VKRNRFASTALLALVFQAPLLADRKSVDCNKGQSLNNAVQGLSPGDTLTFTGVCRENVTVSDVGYYPDRAGRRRHSIAWRFE